MLILLWLLIDWNYWIRVGVELNRLFEAKSMDLEWKLNYYPVTCEFKLWLPTEGKDRIIK